MLFFLRDCVRVTGEMENSRVMGFTRKTRTGHRDLGISRIFYLKKPGDSFSIKSFSIKNTTKVKT
jgi:hypothetical protein